VDRPADRAIRSRANILRPSGIEYVRWAANWRRGCQHGCRYCYAASIAHQFGAEPEAGWETAEAAVPAPGEALRQQLSRKRKPVTGAILVSSSHDPFMPDCCEEGVELIETLGQFGLWPQTLLLSKAPCAALRFLTGLGAGAAGLWFGTSLTSLSADLSARYEPRAENPQERLYGLREALRWGYRTWASLEPPLPGVSLVELVKAVLELSPRPWVVLGKMNVRGGRNGHPDLREWSRSSHWAGDRDEVVRLLEAAGFRRSLTPCSGAFWVKRELARWGI
jgi:DNA repair photolyase